MLKRTEPETMKQISYTIFDIRNVGHSSMSEFRTVAGILENGY